MDGWTADGQMDGQAGRSGRQGRTRNKAAFRDWYNTLITASSLYSDATLAKQPQILKLGLSH